MTYKISIIIPIYNAEFFIEEAFKSIRVQTIGFENLEVIFVNDNSKDNSAAILDRYATLYNNVQAIHLDTSSGAAGKPRNEGILKATSQYIMFMDQDDTFTEDACAVLYNLIVSGKYNIGIATYRTVNEDGSKILSPCVLEPSFPEKIMVNSIADSNQLLTISPSVWTKIFERDFLWENQIFFPEAMVGEDIVFMIHAEMLAKGIIFEKKIVYNYKVRESNQNMSLSHYYTVNFFKDTHKSIKMSYEIMKKYGKEDLFNFILNNHLDHHIYMLFISDVLSEEERIAMFKDAEWIFKQCKIMNVKPRNALYNILFEKLLSKKYIEAIYFYKEVRPIVDEYSNWVSQLEEGKIWLEEQLENHHVEINNQTKVIAELKDWIFQLEKGKKWLEAKLLNLENNQED